MKKNNNLSTHFQSNLSMNFNEKSEKKLKTELKRTIADSIEKSTMMYLCEKERLLCENDLDTILIAKRYVDLFREIISIQFEGYDDLIIYQFGKVYPYDIETYAERVNKKRVNYIYISNYNKEKNTLDNNYITYKHAKRQLHKKEVTSNDFKELVGIPINSIIDAVSKKRTRQDDWRYYPIQKKRQDIAPKHLGLPTNGK